MRIIDTVESIMLAVLCQAVLYLDYACIYFHCVHNLNDRRANGDEDDRVWHVLSRHKVGREALGIDSAQR